MTQNISLRQQQSSQEHAKFVRGTLKVMKESGLQILHGNTLRMHTDIERGDNLSGGISNRDGQRAQSVLQFLINDGISFALDLPQNLPKLLCADPRCAP